MSMMGVSSLLLSLDDTELYRIILDNNMDVLMAVDVAGSRNDAANQSNI